jgi:[ribosomal protein S5]-alanine N-acetyltransferase
MQLSTERLLLREIEPEDWHTIQAYQSDPRYLRFYPWTERTEPDVRAFVQVFLDWQREQPRQRFQLAIIRRADEQMIGLCGIRINDANARQANIGYELNPECWGQGYATEAARELLRFGFGEWGLHRIWAECVAENVASARVMERLGMRQEARFRESGWMKGRWWDCLIYAILETEYRP